MFSRSRTGRSRVGILVATAVTVRHGIERADALHAMLKAFLHEPEFDEPRIEGRGRPDLWIGPQRTVGAPLLEVMTETVPPHDVLVFHVMLARPKFLALLDEA
jgi:hypothetical protein